MGELSAIWSDAKKKLDDQQRAKLPKSDFGKKCDAFEASCAKALRALSDANNAFWDAYADGTKPKAESARDLLSKIMEVCAQYKDINQQIGKETVRLDRLIVGRMNGVLKQYDDNLRKTADSVKESVKS